MLTTGLLFGLASLVLHSQALPEIHHFVLHYDGLEAHQDIIVDPAENYAIITVGRVEGCKNCNSTVNLHDFDTGMVAFKEITSGICLLTKSPLAALNLDIYRLKHSGLVNSFIGYVHATKLSNSAVIATAGERIAEFCREYAVYPMEFIPDVRQNKVRFLETDQTLNTNTDSTKDDICVLCVFCKGTVLNPPTVI